MAQTPTRLYRGRPTVAAQTTVYTVPVGKTAVLKQIILANTSTTGSQFWIVEAGPSAGTVVSLLGVSLAAQSMTVFDLSQVLDAGDVVTVSAPNTLGYTAVWISGLVSP